ncbi:hypothetical protein DB30_03546 [Enhygromyxa salina]|uniref:Uncharacterized protein n=1 Tax=Enhygromyxa salina TaxID=215803 RepID=A0A0C2A1I7_9BACT|nr:hypothetical protein DB30_03546 [Enhygromyxa salina]
MGLSRSALIRRRYRAICFTATAHIGGAWVVLGECDSFAGVRARVDPV